jgi:FixJ family two-component response regulator
LKVRYRVGPPVRVLVVDDDTVFREELSELLREEKHEVEVASSVGKALEWLEREEADVVLTDLKMPRHSGLELLREVRSRWPRTLVVMITGFASVDTALEAMKSGAFDYVRKPFRLEQLRAVLESVSQQRAFSSPAAANQDPAIEARELARRGEMEVLFVAEAAPRPTPHLHFVPLDPHAPAALVDRVRQFVAEYPRPAVLVAGVESMLEHHRLEEVLGVLDQLHALLQGHGPLRVGFDPSKVSVDVATAVGGAVTADETQATMEALANPLRRKALQRLAHAPASFGELMAAAGLDDSPKMSFHLRKLTDAGLLVHEGEHYRLSSRGAAVLRLVADATLLPPPDGSSNRAFTQSSGAGEHGSA